MSSRSVNLTLLVVLSLAFASGVASLVVGGPEGRWLFWLHRVSSLALVVLLLPKLRVVARGYRRRGVRVSTAMSGVFGVLFLGALVVGVAWATVGFPGLRVPLLGGLTGLGIHILLAVLLLPLFVVHTLTRWPRARRVDFASRRVALRYAGLGGVGLALWGGSEAAAKLASLSGARRRFTGSREAGSFSGNGFPSTNWLSDPRPRLSADAWELRMTGTVTQDLVVRYDDLLNYEQHTQRATLDCTGGWYTRQDWSGVPLRALLDAAGIAESARSVVVRSATGYRRRFPLDEADRLILATHVTGEPLTRGHGHPVRLVAPGYRGFEWVKWVVELEVSDDPPWWQAPLPLQ